MSNLSGAAGFTLDADQLRDLWPILRDATEERPDAGDDLPAPAAWIELCQAAAAAAAAEPECPVCRGFGLYLLIRDGDPDDLDTEEHPCPVCRPWPQGFKGVHRGWFQPHRNGPRHTKWVIPPYGPGERPAFIGKGV